MKQPIDQQIQSCLETLSHAIIVAKLNSEIHWIYKSKQTRPKYIQTMSYYWDFFHVSISAHFTAMVVALYSLYEKRKDTVNFSKLLESIKGKPQFSKDVLSDIDKIYRQAVPIWKKVCILRNHVFAHHSDNLDTSDAFKKADITQREIEKLITLSIQLLNEISRNFNRNSWLFNLNSHDDTIRFLEDLNCLRGYRQQQYMKR